MSDRISTRGVAIKMVEVGRGVTTIGAAGAMHRGPRPPGAHRDN